MQEGSNNMEKPTVLTGAMVGLLLTVPLTVLFFIGDLGAGLPLVPFDVFDWVARVLPGPLVTFGIDRLIDVLVALDLEVASVAKTAEHIMAVVGLWLTGAVAGAALFGALRRTESKRGADPGLILGLIVGVPVLLISLNVNRTATTSGFISALYILAAFAAWGIAQSWVYHNLLKRSPEPVEVQAQDRAVTVEQLSRREFLIRTGTTTAAITVVGAGLAALLSTGDEDAEAVAEGLAGAAGEDSEAVASEPMDLPNAADPVKPAPGIRPEYTPLEDHYRIDISARPPTIEEATWTLPITGLVENPLELTLADIRNNYEPMEEFVTLSCISNRVAGDLIGTTTWTGASLQDVLADSGIQPGATHLEVRGGDGFHETVSLDLIDADRRVMLAYAWDGHPLQRKHGFPLRIWIPDRYGMKQPKWITEMEVIDAFRPGYWVSRGWDEDAIVRATAVIDTIATQSTFGDDPVMVPVGGIAYAGARGISKVEVRVNDGDWEEAQLRTPLSDVTWVIWRFDWPLEEGSHTFYVRCTDGNGELQITEENGPRPSGATGVHNISMLV
jgi:DMSO/TMAO reductase YedYZ molybdopterin-dependent catalytic subunit